MQNVFFAAILLFASQQTLIAQTPKLYLGFVSHNEMVNENYDTDSTLFAASTAVVQQIAQAVITKNARWNFETNSRYPLAVIKWQHGATNANNILKTMYNSGKIQLDCRNKKLLPAYNFNISDVAHLLDSVGVVASKNVGGFLYYPYAQQDWTAYNNTIFGTVFHQPYRAEVLWGAGSTPPHTHDADNFGLWKPTGGTDSVSFFTHKPLGNLWVEGHGCSPIIWDTTNVTNVYNEIKDIADNIASGYYPSNQFYVCTIMLNQRDFTTAYAQKVSALIDLINNGLRFLFCGCFVTVNRLSGGRSPL